MNIDEHDTDCAPNDGDKDLYLWEDDDSEEDDLFDSDDPDKNHEDCWVDDPFARMMSRTAEISCAINQCRGVKLEDAPSYDLTVHPCAGCYMSFRHPSRRKACQERWRRQTDILNTLEEDRDEDTPKARINNLRIIAEDLQRARRHSNSCDMMTYRALDAVFRGDLDVDESPPQCTGKAEVVRMLLRRNRSFANASRLQTKRRSCRSRRAYCARSRILCAET